MTDLELLEQQEKKIKDTSEFIDKLNSKAPVTYVTYVLIAINIIVFAIMVSKDAGIMTTSPAVAFAWGANFPPETIDNQWWRIITAAFIHYGIIHLLVNMIALYQSGEFVERVFGRAELTYFLVKNKEIPSELYGKYFLNLLIFIGYNLFYGFTNSAIDNWAHLGGALGGMIVVSPFLVRSLFKEMSYQKRNIKMALSTISSLIVIALLINPAVHASTPYVNVKNYRNELASFITVETGLDGQYAKLYEAVNKISSPVSYSDFNNFLEKSMIPELERGKEKLLKYDTSSNSKVLNIQKETTIYLDLRIKAMSKHLAIMKDIANNKAPKKEDYDQFNELSEKFANQSKKVIELIKEEYN